MQACNDALGHEAGTLRFHLDPENTRNCSLNQSAMPLGHDCATITVSVRSAGLEAERWLSTGAPIFYKSDTQGHDELIATSIATPFWDRVFAGIFELWHIDKPQSSEEQLTVLLDQFAHKHFSRIGTRRSVRRIFLPIALAQTATSRTSCSGSRAASLRSLFLPGAETHYPTSFPGHRQRAGARSPMEVRSDGSVITLRGKLV